MTDAEIAKLARSVTEAGLAGKSETVLLVEFCERLREVGMPLARASVIIDTLHPVYEGRVFRWERDRDEPTLLEYGRSGGDNEADERWRQSPFFQLIDTGAPMLHRRLSAETDGEF